MTRVSRSANCKGQPFWQQSWLSFIRQNPHSNLGKKLIKVIHISNWKKSDDLMPRLHLPRSSYDLIVYDFPDNFFVIIGSYKLQCMCLHCLRSPCNFFRRQTRTKPDRDLADIVRQPQHYRAVIVLSSRPPYINRTMPIR